MAMCVARFTHCFKLCCLSHRRIPGVVVAAVVVCNIGTFITSSHRLLMPGQAESDLQMRESLEDAKMLVATEWGTFCADGDMTKSHDG